MMGFLAYLVGLVADLISFNRQLLEMTLERVRRLELDETRNTTRANANSAPQRRAATGEPI